MSHRGRVLLADRYGVDPALVADIPHGVPDVPFVPTAPAKAGLGLGDRPVILSYGLISPNKGLETVIGALAMGGERLAAARLVIAGATHPEVRRRHGEAYRASLQALALRLDVERRVVFVDRYLDDEELRRWILAADVFVTAHTEAAQVTSGTLAYAVASGRAVISTPYEHARELLAEGRGVLVPFGSSARMADALVALLTDDEHREGVRRAAWERGRAMTWSAVASAYVALLDDVASEAPHR
jgi:glycosyltransferase involved in cell wall biosynthesis